MLHLNACRNFLGWGRRKSGSGLKRASRFIITILAVQTMSYALKQPINSVASPRVRNGRSLLFPHGNSSGNDSCPGLTRLRLDWSSLHELGLSYEDLEKKCDNEELDRLAELDLSSAEQGGGVAWETCDFEENNYPALFLVVHIIIVIILFVGLAIICDDFFVPSLEAISEKLDLSEDVAGATFMAAGSSAPELFTSIAAVTVTSDVGIGTIVGSAVFNILMIIALTAALAGQVLFLDWRPILRDSLFYALSIVTFIGFSWDGLIEYYEAAALLGLYILYVVIMKFNSRGMALLGKCNHSKIGPEVSTDEGDDKQLKGNISIPMMSADLKDMRRCTIAIAETNNHRFLHLRGGELSGSFANHRPSIVLQGSVRDLLSSSRNAIAAVSQRALLQPGIDDSSKLSASSNTLGVNYHSRRRFSHQDPLQQRSLLAVPAHNNNQAANGVLPIERDTSVEIFAPPADDGVSVTRTASIHSGSRASLQTSDFNAINATGPELVDEDKVEVEETLVPCPCLPPINAQFPSRDLLKSASSKAAIIFQLLRLIFKWILFIVSFPFLCVFTWTVPPCSKPEHRKYFVASFLMSIVWIAALSFGTVVFVQRIGCILDIDHYTMGLVVVAIGTSIPDCLSSILVARDGFGDMAVSNAIGSNVFDINLGIGLPYLIKSIIDSGKPVLLVTPVELVSFRLGFYDLVPHAKFGFILLLILIIAIISFIVTKFKLNRFISICFVVLYGMFLFYAFWQDIRCYKGRTC